MRIDRDRIPSATPYQEEHSTMRAQRKTREKPGSEGSASHTDGARRTFHLANWRPPTTATGDSAAPEQAIHATASVASPVRVEARDITQTVHEGFPFFETEKVLLDDVSITLQPGTFVALVGPSGAGKTSLLRALSGQTQGERGGVFYNGMSIARRRQDVRTTMGYVPQDDIVHKNLTVEGALTYAAELRLPCDTPRPELLARVHQVLEDVELTDQRHQLISHLSGGQRKRVNMALELLGRPSVFYLDEPTSGLDPDLALKIMQMLRRLADRGQTVVLVTHTTANIELCDAICFLAPGGRLAYYGPPERLKAFFRSDTYAEIYSLLHENPAYWAARFRQAPEYERYVMAPQEQSTRLASVASTDRIDKVKNASHPVDTSCVSGIRQFWVLTRRYFDLMLHDLPTLLTLLLQAPVIAILVWLLADHDVLHNVAAGLRPNGPPEDIYAQRVLFVVIASAVWFGIINAAREIVKEAPIFRREHAVNLGLLPYVFSKVAVLGGLLALQNLVLLAIVGLRTGYPADGLIWQGETGAFAELYITLLLVSLVGLMLGLLISALVPNSDRAVSIVPVLLIPQIIFANVIFVLDDDVGRTLSYVMPSRWGMQAAGSIVGAQDRFTDHAVFPFYASDPPHVFAFWGALLLLTTLYLGLTLLAMRAKDAR